MTAQELANQIFQRQGCVVVTDLRDLPMGHVIVVHEGLYLDNPETFRARVVAEASAHEFIQQRRIVEAILGIEPCDDPINPNSYFFRIEAMD